jgi:hypothetical protein
MVTPGKTRPRGFSKRGGIWWFQKQQGGKVTRVSTGQHDLDAAIAWICERSELNAMMNASRRPKGFYKRGNFWHFRSVGVSGTIRISTGQRDLQDAIEWVKGRPELSFTPSTRPPPPINPFHGTPFVFTDQWIKDAICRATRSKHSYSLTTEQLKQIIERANGRCEVTGIPFTYDKPMGALRAPYVPSLDRVDTYGPYSYSNCRLVCLAVNVALNQWGDTVFDLICLGRCTQRLAALGSSVLPHGPTRNTT